MRHQRLHQTLGLRPDERKALLASLATALAEHGRIETTIPKAKAAQRFVERLITVAKQKTLHARRQLISELRSSDATSVFMEEIAPSVNGRKGGYTRIIRYRRRIGDGVETALLEFTDQIKRREAEDPKKDKKKKKVKASTEIEEPEVTKKQKKQKPPAEEKPEKSTESVQALEPAKSAEEQPKEKPKKGGFLGGLRKFLKGED